jgi:hypothetical protein
MITSTWTHTASASTHISIPLPGVIRLLEGFGILDIGLQCVSSCQLLSFNARNEGRNHIYSRVGIDHPFRTNIQLETSLHTLQETWRRTRIPVALVSSVGRKCLSTLSFIGPMRNTPYVCATPEFQGLCPMPDKSKMGNTRAQTAVQPWVLPGRMESCCPKYEDNRSEGSSSQFPTVNIVLDMYIKSA